MQHPCQDSGGRTPRTIFFLFPLRLSEIGLNKDATIETRRCSPGITYMEGVWLRSTPWFPPCDHRVELLAARVLQIKAVTLKWNTVADGTLRFPIRPTPHERERPVQGVFTHLKILGLCARPTIRPTHGSPWRPYSTYRRWQRPAAHDQCQSPIPQRGALPVTVGDSKDLLSQSTEVYRRLPLLPLLPLHGTNL